MTRRRSMGQWRGFDRPEFKSWLQCRAVMCHEATWFRCPFLTCEMDSHTGYLFRSCCNRQWGIKALQSMWWISMPKQQYAWHWEQKTLHETWCVSRDIVLMKLPVTSCPELWPLHHPNSVRGGMFKLNTKLGAGPLLYVLSRFECDGHTVHTLTQWRLPPPLTSTVKSSLFTHVHPSPLSLAARLRRCCTDCSCYSNNGWTLSGQTSYVYIPVYMCANVCI